MYANTGQRSSRRSHGCGTGRTACGFRRPKVQHNQAAAFPRISFSMRNARFSRRSLTTSSCSAVVRPSLWPSSMSARASQLRRQLSLMPMSAAMLAMGLARHGPVGLHAGGTPADETVAYGLLPRGVTTSARVSGQPGDAQAPRIDHIACGPYARDAGAARGVDHDEAGVVTPASQWSASGLAPLDASELRHARRHDLGHDDVSRARARLSRMRSSPKSYSSP